MPDALAKGGEAKDPGAREESPKDESGPGHIRLRNRALILAAAEEVFATQGYRGATTAAIATTGRRSEEHTSELQSLMRSSYAVFCLKKKKMHIYSMCNPPYSNSTLIHIVVTHIFSSA